MTNILKEKIIIPAWEIIKNDSKIKKFYILPWLLSIIFLTAILVYQTIYTYVELFWKKEEALVIILKFLHSNYIFEFLSISIIFLIVYFLLTPIFEWWLIKYINYKNEKEDITSSDAFWEWLQKFLPVFEYNNMFSEFKIISILNWYLFILRFIWLEYISILNYIFLVLFLLSIILNVLFAYSKYIIILEDKNVFESIWISSKIAILNLRRTIKIYFFILFLNLRVIFNFIVFLIFPVIIVLAISFITSKIFFIIAISIITILFIFFILILWYLTSILEIFITSIWFYAYKEWSNKIKKEE